MRHLFIKWRSLSIPIQIIKNNMVMLSLTTLDITISEKSSHQQTSVQSLPVIFRKKEVGGSNTLFFRHINEKDINNI